VYSARLLYIGLGPLRQRPHEELAGKLGTPGERFASPPRWIGTLDLTAA
jgi:hypothetical protein